MPGRRPKDPGNSQTPGSYSLDRHPGPARPPEFVVQHGRAGQSSRQASTPQSEDQQTPAREAEASKGEDGPDGDAAFTFDMPGSEILDPRPRPADGNLGAEARRLTEERLTQEEEARQLQTEQERISDERRTLREEERRQTERLEGARGRFALEELQKALEEGRRANDELRRQNAEREEEKEDLRKYLKSSTQRASELFRSLPEQLEAIRERTQSPAQGANNYAVKHPAMGAAGGGGPLGLRDGAVVRPDLVHLDSPPAADQGLYPGRGGPTSPSGPSAPSGASGTTNAADSATDADRSLSRDGMDTGR